MADVYLCSRSQNECVTIFCTLSFLSPHNLLPWQEDIHLSFSQSSSRRCLSAGGYTANHYVNVVNSSFKALPGLNYKNKTAKQWHWCQRRAISSILASQKNTAIIPYCFCISPQTTGLRGVIKGAVKLSAINSNKGSPQAIITVQKKNVYCAKFIFFIIINHNTNRNTFKSRSIRIMRLFPLLVHYSTKLDMKQYNSYIITIYL